MLVLLNWHSVDGYGQRYLLYRGPSLLELSTRRRCESVMQRSSRNRSGTTTVIMVYGLSLELHPGDSVFVKCDGQKSWKLPAEVVRKCAPRSYIVQSAGGQLRRNRKHLQQQTTINSSPAVANETTPGPAFVSDQSIGQEPQGQQSPSLFGRPPDLQSSGQPPSPSPSPSLGQSPQAVRGSSTALMQPSTEQYPTRSGRVVVKPARFIED